MHNETDSYKNCKDLQNLINITLNDVIEPLRCALNQNSSSQIIKLEIKDAENKAFEYIASQITAIGNATDSESNQCLQDFPKSDVCYKCLGLDDHTIQGLIKIRKLSFDVFLELDKSSCQELLCKYIRNVEFVDSIIDATQIIKDNVDLMYSNETLKDNTRNLIKLVTRLIDNKSTVEDINVIGIPDWSCPINNEEFSEDPSNYHTSNPEFDQYSNLKHYDTRNLSDSHPFNITSTKKPVNLDTVLKAYNLLNDARNHLNAKQNNLNSLSVPNTPNIQKCRSVGGSEEILNDVTQINEKQNGWSSISPLTNRKKNHSHSKAKSASKGYNQLQRSHSHEFEYNNHLSDKDMKLDKNNASVFHFKDNVEIERRSSYEEKSLHNNDFNTDVENSPKTSKNVDTGLKGSANHKFELESKFGLPNIKPAMCSVCRTKKLLTKLLICENCKIKVHKSCLISASDIPCIVSVSPVIERKNSQNSMANISINFQGSDSNSASSCNSSPASPFNAESGYNSGVNNHVSPRHPNKRLANQKFEFSVIDETDTIKNIGDEINSVRGSESTTIINPLNKPVQRLESTESQDEFSRLSRANSISVALKEWEIPLENLELKELLGQGSFSTVYKGKWHGEVAVKIMNIDSQDEFDSCMSAFKSEVGALHKTRHENLVLFMGACMKPPKLAIVTQLSQGETLYHQLHSKHINFPIIRAINIASQVAKGMGYLHAKEILHKDLKSRNIFIENNCKAVISDFGLFDFVRMCKQARSGSYLRIPHGWLCYLSPELIKKLNLNFIFSNTGNEDLPFTKASDIFAFGTIWYEILNSKWPYEGLPSEAIIYKVGKGIKESLKITHAKEFKDLLLLCWATNPVVRPHFTSVVQLLEKLPKLQRSPSYPVKSVTVGRSHDNLMT